MMGVRLSAWIGAALFLLLPTAGRTELYQWRQIVDEDEAVRMVREFEGDPTAKVKITKTPKLSSLEPRTLPELWQHYRLETNRRRYLVGVYHQRFACEDKDYCDDPERGRGYTPDEKIDRSKMIPESKARAIAVQYLRMRYPAPDVVYGEGSSPGIHRPYGPRDHYGYSFHQHLGKGVVGPNRCYIRIDSVSGRVVEYRAETEPVLISPTPTLSTREAAACAVAAMGLKNARLAKIKGPRVTFPDAVGMQRLVYDMVIWARTRKVVFGWDKFSLWGSEFGEQMSVYVDQPWPTPFSLIVDAHDGTVLDWNIAGGMQRYPLDEPVRPARGRVYRPLRVKKGEKGMAFRCLSVGGRPFVPAEYLCYGDPTAKLVRKGDSISIEGKKRHVRLSLKSRNYSLNGHRKRSPAGPVMAHSVPYVHASALKGIVHFRFGYRWWTRTFWLVTPPPIRWTDFIMLYIVLAAAGLVLLILRIRSRRRARREQRLS